MDDIEQIMRERRILEICDCALGVHLIPGIEPDEECVEAANEIAKLRAEVERLNKSRNKWGQKYNKLLEKHKITLSDLKMAIWCDSEVCKLLTAEVEKLKSDLQAADIVVSRLNGGKALQDLMHANNERIEIIEKLRAEIEKLRKVLKSISDRRNGPRWTVAPDNAFSAVIRLNDEMLAIFAECDAALEEGKQNEGEGQEHVNLSR